MSLKNGFFQPFYSTYSATESDNQQFLYADADEQIEETEEDSHKKTPCSLAVLPAQSLFFSQGHFIQSELKLLSHTAHAVTVSRLFVLFRNFRL